MKFSVMVVLVIIVAQGLSERRLVSVNFLVTGIAYDLLPHWATFFWVFFTMLAIHTGRQRLASQQPAT